MKKCLICGGGYLTHETRDLPYEYQTGKTILKDISGEYCDKCGEIILTPEQSDALCWEIALNLDATKVKSL
ncbi:type II toxin-antitoxin system MqsA family antitoxin [Atlantibacter hermannii]|uniref:type II toxin-antitoxin system MqsA family antitoxin n=1 Tax=Atlantibacter hermannii TaxID=565 RepID=UPI00193461F3|nr:type II toxin-antitoxin system MqsA family antitoxin [Atlantibacter hermannii]MBL7634250.1 type II toxin-antitoxin system MqsA family antitoxin [Atlantibacter hermannii]MBL7673967.1 type II toxin-antitoxin system MqsA family antitoxin [Atlantibacter hermannii]MCZ7836995.1 type II toxin-antitoxin system MqsA family antitoxin [Atlantibacter hermannii]